MHSISSAQTSAFVLQAMHDLSFSRMRVHCFGDPANDRVMICVHGITRTGLDFLPFARAMSRKYFVVCPDLPGHGESEPAHPLDYRVSPFSAGAALLTHFSSASEIVWVGTSLGGRAGIFLAARERCPIRRLVINDIAPVFTTESAKSAQKFLRWNPGFQSIEAGAALLGKINDCRDTSEATARELQRRAALNLQRRADGRYYYNHDPHMADWFDNFDAREGAMWSSWQRIECPILVLRGEHSRLLSPDDLMRMGRDNPRVTTREVPDIGHAPLLASQTEIDFVAAWLDRLDPVGTPRGS